MKILITGGAGFIGSSLADSFLLDGHEVYVIDNLSTGFESNIADHRNNLNFYFYNNDIAEYEVLFELCNKCEMIFHLASSVGVKYIMENKVKGLDSNLLGSISIIKIAAQLKKKIVIFSSSETYGDNDIPMLHENDKRVLGQSFRWSYAIGKIASEYYAEAYGKENGLEYNVIRCFNIVGPRQVGDYGMVLPKLIMQALEGKPMTIYDDGKQIRSFTYVQDLINIVKAIMSRSELKQEIFNIGSHNSISILELALKIKEITKSESEILFMPSKDIYGDDFEDIKIRIPNNEYIMETINGYSFLNLDDIIRNIIDSILENKKI